MKKIVSFFTNLAWKQANRQFFLKPCFLGSRSRKFFPLALPCTWGTWGRILRRMVKSNLQKMSFFFVLLLIFSILSSWNLVYYFLFLLSSKTILSSMYLYFPTSRSPCDVVICRIAWFLTKWLKTPMYLLVLGRNKLTRTQMKTIQNVSQTMSNSFKTSLKWPKTIEYS